MRSGRERAHEREPALAVERHAHLVPLELEIRAQRAREIDAVLYDQNSRHISSQSPLVRRRRMHRILRVEALGGFTRMLMPGTSITNRAPPSGASSTHARPR